jgi:hypothetical protein
MPAANSGIVVIESAAHTALHTTLHTALDLSECIGRQRQDRGCEKQFTENGCAVAGHSDDHRMAGISKTGDKGKWRSKKPLWLKPSLSTPTFAQVSEIKDLLYFSRLHQQTQLSPSVNIITFRGAMLWQQSVPRR